MTHILQIILDDISTLPDILQVWREIGVSGTTIMKSVGGYRTTTWLSNVGLGAIDKLFDNKEIQRRTLIAIIEDDELLERAIAEAERIVGGFDRPNSGVLLVLPVTKTIGLYKAEPKPPQGADRGEELGAARIIRPRPWFSESPQYPSFF